MRITAIIPNYNGGTRLDETLASLAQQTLRPESVLVVDNGSTDTSADRAEASGARVLRMDRNLGFAAAVNHGIREAGGDFLFLLNNDVRLEPGYLDILAGELAAEPSVWFATGRLLQAAHPDRIDATFDALSRSGCAWRCGNGIADSPLWRTKQEIRFPPLTATLLRAGLFEHAGPLDEEFVSYLEDVEFGLRCASLGYTGRYVPQAAAYHHGSATRGAWHPVTTRQMARNQLLLVARHYPENWLFSYGWPIAVGQTLWGLLALRQGVFVPWLAGKWEGIRMFRRCRRSGPPSVRDILAESESELHRLQGLAGMDWFWRVYFALT